ncbi:MAG: hypothetical protein IJN50_04425 [Clostridia bacterium]|nr:hypothetical protein [Clostridia bacterium]
MGYKIRNTIKKSKMVFVVMAVVWIALGILLMAPIAVSLVESLESTASGTFDSNNFFSILFTKFGTIGSNMGKVFRPKYIATYGKCMGWCTFGVLVLGIYGMLKSMPRNEYTDIEHGSSDWSTNKEKYKVLSPNKGILLAEKHYLPVDKRGNVNVMVVGRFRFW